METPEQRKKIIEQNRFKRSICKNGIFSLEKGELVNTGCKNPRANGSSRCKECSENYKTNTPHQ